MTSAKFILFAASLASLLSASNVTAAEEPEKPAEPAKPVATKPSLGVSVFTFRNTTGKAIVSLFKVEKNWPDGAKAYKRVARKITGKSVWVKFKDLDPGTYAVSVLHDENSNNKMDMKWLPYPRPGEGVGSSNNYDGRPKWRHAKFTLANENKKLKIRLRYF